MQVQQHLGRIQVALGRVERLVPRIALAATPIALFLLFRGQRDALGVFGTVGWQPLVLSGIAFALAPLLQGLSFWLVLRYLTGTTQRADAMLIWSRSYVLRYAPTGALAVAYRLSARKRLRASADQVLAAYAYEHVGALAAAAAACLAFFALAGRLPPLIPLAIAVVTLALTAALTRGVAGRAVQRLARRLGLHLSVVIGGRQLATVIAVNALGWLGTGTAVYVLVASLTHGSPGFIWLAGAYTAGYLVGFVAPLAPGGLGVREATLVILLGARYGTATALDISLAIRIANVAGELAAVSLVHAIYAVPDARGLFRRRTGTEGVGAPSRA